MASTKKPQRLVHERVNKNVEKLLDSVPELELVIKLDEQIAKRGLTRAKLATITGLRPNTVSEFARGDKQMIAKAHLIAMMVALRITDIRDIIEIQFSPATKTEFKREARAWVEDGVAPAYISKLFMENSLEQVQSIEPL